MDYRVRLDRFCVFLSLFCVLANASFVYRDFNETDGIHFNGAAGTTRCFNDTLEAYGDYQGDADRFNEDVLTEIGETTVLISESTVETNEDFRNNETDNTLAGFIHRSGTKSAPNRCAGRIRLTPSGPSKAGSIFFVDQAPVNNGFDTYFTFQVTDHSKQCTVNKDQYFSQFSHRTCSVHGADGLAFVVQNSPSKTRIVGKVGEQMGFGGIPNSLAIAFDTWQNQGEDSLNVDHVSVQSRGVLENDALELGLLGVPRAHDIADGEIHLARIVYYNDLKPEYFDKLVASDSLLPYLKDNGEQKRVGTLVVYMDEGVAEDVPLLALPINLSLLLDLPIDKAYVGFTSSTGRFYEKHDILSWTFCDQPPCDAPTLADFDYHQTSKFTASKRRNFTPGPGFGGGDTSGFPTKNKSPDTTTFGLPVESWSKSRNFGLATDASNQIPPETLYRN
uniref:Legume lectin domain-containing protein n=1 Tax=Spumella elongata TaxID=89044 RepID=A0A7S3GU82_9STRA